MAADLPGSDPKALWKGLDEEAEAMTLDRIHALVRRYDRRVGFSVAAMAALLLIVGLLGGQALAKAHDTVMRAWGILFIAGEVSVCALAYRVAFPQRDPAEPAGAYLRRRLQIRLDYARGKWLLMIAPLAPFIVLSTYVQIAGLAALGVARPAICTR